MTTTDVEAATDQHHHRPAFGFTKLGHPVHAKVTDHLPTNSPYARFNKHFALLITNNVGTMTCFWIFCVVALVALPAVLVESNIVHGIGIIGSTGFAYMVAWLAQSFIQLVLLPALMVGQNLQNIAADARSAKTFDDVERIIDLLDAHTQGGIKEILEKLAELGGNLPPAAAPAAAS
ncbi:MAG TPA: hypothetical protein VME46_06795 [Acidimicrobiales bacterium]|nr:hypothetical protein [Acidimicrobiales bacterium]